MGGKCEVLARTGARGLILAAFRVRARAGISCVFEDLTNGAGSRSSVYEAIRAAAGEDEVGRALAVLLRLAVRHTSWVSRWRESEAE